MDTFWLNYVGTYCEHPAFTNDKGMSITSPSTGLECLLPYAGYDTDIAGPSHDFVTTRPQRQFAPIFLQMIRPFLR